ncbi:MAG: cytochrome d ubiquinol oxidase subunit II [Proteobacteria bacterium]|nr:cytochrome d ubiquinol oxidase subunit II [Pseudomonadota bacterium]
MHLDLVLIWGGIIAFAVFAYVVMDGFDLGIGILFPALAAGPQRDMAMNSIAPVWDGNETWLVMGGGGLLAAFPLAYAIILPATYPLIIAMLLGLVFRGVAFEFRWRDAPNQHRWDLAFTTGSFVAAMAQGMILGAILQGITVRDGAYVGGWLDWLSPFSLLTGVSVVLGYALLGSTWLVWKTEGAGHDLARGLAQRLTVATLLALGAVSLATPFLQFSYWQRWFTMPNLVLTAPVPLLVLLAAWALLRGLARGDHMRPFVLALCLFLLGFAGLAISLFPYLVPGALTIWDAAAPPASLSFMLAGAAFIIPAILGYTAWAYWVFRGKVGDHGYH